ncbi:oxygen oxidoreductase, partial [Aureobasidium melanogenum]
MADRQAPIAVLGGGAWGLSTALHLSYNGYTNITVFERAEEIPSPHSAAYDINKIVRAEYEDPFYTNLALEAIRAWKTPLFGPVYHQTGYIVATTGRAPQKARDHLEKALQTISSHPVFSSEIMPLRTAEDFRHVAWQFSGPLNGFTGYYNALAGYAHSSDALHKIWLHCAKQGIKFVMGESAGRVVELVYSGQDGPRRRCVGVKTADGKLHPATQTICALGANGASLVPELGRFVVARCWSVAHVQLTKEETDLLRGLPTTNVRDLGFFFEPDPETRLFKLCPLGAGYTNRTGKAKGLSLPPQRNLEDFIPIEDERKLRQLLRETFPWMADRPFVDKKLCWFADTRDSDFCIDFLPQTDRSVIVLSGDSGHGFKMMPVFGKWVMDLLEAGKQQEPRWQWRNVEPGQEDSWDDSVSWRIGKSRELSDLAREKARLEQARL